MCSQRFVKALQLILTPIRRSTSLLAEWRVLKNLFLSKNNMADDKDIIMPPFNEKQYNAYLTRLDSLYEKLDSYSEDDVIEAIQREITLLQDIIYQIKR